MNLIKKTLLFKANVVDDTNYIIRGIFSSGIEDRQSEVVDQNGWKLEEYMTNPVVLFAHDHHQPAIGKCVELGKDAMGNLQGAIQFAANEYDFAKTIFNLYKSGFMRAFSVGFMNDKYEIDQANDRVVLRENTLYEISCVNVPANAMALASSKGIDMAPLERVQHEMRMKSVVPYADHGTVDENTTWDGPAEMTAGGDDLAKLKSIKLPHHQADGLNAVWKGVAAAMGALLGARGGVSIPDADRQGVYGHLAKHYKQFDKEVPEFKTYTQEELKQIEETGNIQKNADDAIKTITSSNKETIRSAIRTLTEVLKASEADNQVDKGRTPLTEGGVKKIPVKMINKAVRELLLIKSRQ